MYGPAIRNRLGGSVEDQSLSPIEKQLATHIAIGGRILHDEGHDDINQGQISARIPNDTGHFLIKQVLAGFDEVTPGEVVRCAMDFRVAAHRLAPPEIPLHQAIYAARPDVNAVVHSHAPNSLAFGALDEPLHPISHEGACFHGRYTVFTGTSHTVLEIETGRAIAASLGAAKAVFLRNHGVVVVGKSVKEAIVLATVLERACDLQLRVLASGRPFARSNDEDVKLKQDFIFGDMSVRAFWDHKVRKVRRAAARDAAAEDLAWLPPAGRKEERC
jgi:L-fuculose-phosphate aldolase